MITSEHATHTHEHSKNLRVKEPRAAPGAGGGRAMKQITDPGVWHEQRMEMCQEDQGQHPGVCEDWNSQNTRQETAECLFRGLSHASAQDSTGPTAAPRTTATGGSGPMVHLKYHLRRHF